MANSHHLQQLKQSVTAWNKWRQDNREIRPSLCGAELIMQNLSDANLSHCDLRGADLQGTNLSGANLSAADLSGANVSGTDFTGACLSNVTLDGFFNATYDDAVAEELIQRIRACVTQPNAV